MFAQVARMSPRNLLAALALAAVVAAQGRAEHPKSSSSCCPFPSPPGVVVPPVMPPADVPPERRPPGGEVSMPPPPAETPPSEDPGAFAMGLTPNVFGDLLFASRSVNFSFVRINGTTNFQGLASTSIVNASVAENNSPVPRDRVFFRYNYFNRAQAVTGLSPRTVVQILPGPDAVFPPGSEFPGTPLPPALLQLPQTRTYDSNTYTFGFEKTFFDNLVSVELRAPFVTGLATDNTFSTGNIGGFTGLTDTPFGGSGLANFNVNATPQNTLGHQDTEWGNLTVILKGLLYQNRCNGLSISGGTGITIPTAQDTHVRVIDYAARANDPFATSQRRQDITIENETWSLSPFLAALYVPNDRLFTQGFGSVEVPLGSSRIRYRTQRFAFLSPGAPLTPRPDSLVTASPSIDEQTLLHLDWNVGYWVYRDPESRWLKGIAPAFEVHYTTTLENANRAQLPGDGSTMIPPVPLNRLPLSAGQIPDQVPAPGPVVGSSRNRVDIWDLTAGTTFLIGDRATLATAFSVPVSSSTNKTFEWEFQLQLNYYFGGAGRGPLANLFR